MEADRAALLIPGRAYDVRQPLFAFARAALERRAAAVHEIAWSPPDLAEPIAWVRDQVTAVLPDGSRPLLVGKSLGSLAAGVAADHGLPAIWLTPLLHDPRYVGEYKRATAPALLIGGTADPAWDTNTAESLSSHIVAIDQADHGMFRPGPLAETVRAHGEVITAIEAFLDEVVWP